MTQSGSTEGQFQLHGLRTSQLFSRVERRHFKLPHADSEPIFSKLITSDLFIYVGVFKTTSVRCRKRIPVNFVRSTDAKCTRTARYDRTPGLSQRCGACGEEVRGGDHRACVEYSLRLRRMQKSSPLKCTSGGEMHVWGRSARSEQN